MRAGSSRSPSFSRCRCALLGTVGALTFFGAANNLYTQIGIILLIALGSKNAILIVEYARQQRAEGRAIIEAAVEGARLRFRPILMTSFAFILGVLPLVLATGAGAGARRSIGIAVFYGMLASTCLVVVFVPSFFVVMQWLEERRKGKPAPKDAAPLDQPRERALAGLVTLGIGLVRARLWSSSAARLIPARRLRAHGP